MEQVQGEVLEQAQEEGLGELMAPKLEPAVGLAM